MLTISNRRGNILKNCITKVHKYNPCSELIIFYDASLKKTIIIKIALRLLSFF